MKIRFKIIGYNIHNDIIYCDIVDERPSMEDINKISKNIPIIKYFKVDLIYERTIEKEHNFYEDLFRGIEKWD